jgi:putative endonuclease
MFVVYALHSQAFNKIYIGFTSNLESRLNDHNFLSTKGYTVKYRPWVLIYSENCETKKQALLREKQLKTAAGRKFIRTVISEKKALL